MARASVGPALLGVFAAAASLASLIYLFTA